MDNKTRALLMGAAGAAGESLYYVEDVFSTYLYDGNGSTQTITNDIDLAGEGGLVWIKSRSNGEFHALYDTSRGAGKNLSTADIQAEQIAPSPYELYNFGNTGFSVGEVYYRATNISGQTYASWTFRKAPKFFDVVTWTGDGTVRQISHSLGSVPGCIIVKRTDAANYNWFVYHRSLGNSQYLILETTNAAASSSAFWNATTPTASVFTVGNTSSTNASGGTYVAYLFAHDAGGFGDSGTESVIKCGSFTADGVGKQTVDLGWEPQWVLVKSINNSGDWQIIDNMRGWTVFPANTAVLRANLPDQESTNSTVGNPTATGFIFYGPLNNEPYIYIAIRRGPMKTPEDATKVFKATAYSGTEPTPQYIQTGFTVDFNIYKYRTLDYGSSFWDRLRGGNLALISSSSDQEIDVSSDGSSQIIIKQFQRNDGFAVGSGANNAGGANSLVNYAFRRAPGFFDIVTYSGTSVSRTVNHNLGVTPELIIVKVRNFQDGWAVYSAARPASERMRLNSNVPSGSNTGYWNSTPPTSSVFTVGDDPATNRSPYTYVAYLFATCPGVSKVGNYTGTGNTLNIDCGFTTGARFLLIKRTDQAGDWYIWDSARGIIAGDDPYFKFNSPLQEVTNDDYIDPLNTGFQISSNAPVGINELNGSYIFLAIA